MEVVLAPADPGYAELFLAYRQDPVTLAYNPLQPSTLEDLRERLRSSRSEWSSFDSAESMTWFAQVSGEIVGNASLQNINRMMLTAEIGYGIFAPARGRGIAILLVRKIAQDAFAFTQLRKLVAYVHANNVASQRVLEKVGFIQEGLLRKHYLVNGKPADEHIYGLLRGEVH